MLVNTINLCIIVIVVVVVVAIIIIICIRSWTSCGFDSANALRYLGLSQSDAGLEPVDVQCRPRGLFHVTLRHPRALGSRPSHWQAGVIPLAVSLNFKPAKRQQSDVCGHGHNLKAKASTLKAKTFETRAKVKNIGLEAKARAFEHTVTAN